jgi:hypothetical protein
MQGYRNGGQLILQADPPYALSLTNSERHYGNVARRIVSDQSVWVPMTENFGTRVEGGIEGAIEPLPSGGNYRTASELSFHDLVRVSMKIFLMAIVVFGYMAADMSNASAATQRERAKALTECTQEAMAMRLAKKTIRRKNFIMDCMTDRGIQG